MTIKKLKEMIADLPDNMRIYADDGIGFFKGNSEFLCIAACDEVGMAVFQTANEIETEEETTAILNWFEGSDWEEQDAWIEMHELGYKPEDFADPEYARKQMEHYGLLEE